MSGGANPIEPTCGTGPKPLYRHASIGNETEPVKGLCQAVPHRLACIFIVACRLLARQGSAGWTTMGPSQSLCRGDCVGLSDLVDMATSGLRRCEGRAPRRCRRRGENRQADAGRRGDAGSGPNEERVREHRERPQIQEEIARAGIVLTAMAGSAAPILPRTTACRRPAPPRPPAGLSGVLVAARFLMDSFAMARPWNDWYACDGNPYGTWLRSGCDPRRSRERRQADVSSVATRNRGRKPMPASLAGRWFQYASISPDISVRTGNPSRSEGMRAWICASRR